MHRRPPAPAPEPEPVPPPPCQPTGCCASCCARTMPPPWRWRGPGSKRPASPSAWRRVTRRRALWSTWSPPTSPCWTAPRTASTRMGSRHAWPPPAYRSCSLPRWTMRRSSGVPSTPGPWPASPSRSTLRCWCRRFRSGWRAAQIHRLAEVERSLRNALLASRTVGTAVGILMERGGVNADSAFETLRRRARHDRLSVRRLAARIVGDSPAQSDAEAPSGARGECLSA
jgi:hypothetical protein